jgi:hypothetical protein
MTGRHAHASGNGRSRTALSPTRAAIITGLGLVALAAAGLAGYSLFFASGLVAAFSALTVFWAALCIFNLVRRRGVFWRWFSAGFLLSMISQLISALGSRHQWLAGHPHLTTQLSDWAEWTGLAFVAMAIVLGVRSGELRFWRSRSPSAVTSAETDTEE